MHHLLLLSVATSIDAFAVGVTFAFLSVFPASPVAVIGLVTFVFSLAGVFIGKRAGHSFEGKIEVIGGLVLIGTGTKILVEHML
jgi:putative Mn2+ efflux pump MntP